MGNFIIVPLDGKIEWQVKRDKSGMWIATCYNLEIEVMEIVYFDVVEQACELTQDYFQDLFDDGELQSFLDKLGIKGTIPEWDYDNAYHFDIPIEIRYVHLTSCGEPND